MQGNNYFVNSGAKSWQAFSFAERKGRKFTERKIRQEVLQSKTACKSSNRDTKMAAVYKSINKQKANGANGTNGSARNGDGDEDKATRPNRNRQRVLMLTSRGVTYR